MICPQCARHFEADSRGRPRVYCSAACRQRAYRQRNAFHAEPKAVFTAIRSAASALGECGRALVLLTEGWSPPDHLAGPHRMDHLMANVEYLACRLSRLRADAPGGGETAVGTPV